MTYARSRYHEREAYWSRYHECDDFLNDFKHLADPTPRGALAGRGVNVGIALGEISARAKLPAP